MQNTAVSYPAVLTFDPPERIANWRPLVQWFLAIPHFIILYFLGIASFAISVVSWFAILFTGVLPVGMANFQAMYIRYSARVIAYSAFLREEYPAFAFSQTAADPGDDPRLRIDLQPSLENRNRMTVGFRWILAIPHFIALAFLGMVTYVLIIIGFFAVLFTGRWPAGLRDFGLGVGRWFLRANAYILLLTDEYPPFSTD
jgi:hypothetical protein